MPARSETERFHVAGTPSDFDLLSFWRWSSSDLLSNTLRGVLAEFLVARALGLTGKPRTEWDACDLVTDTGVRIEVKSAAYVQSWRQSRPSPIAFDIGRKLAWDASTATYATERARTAHVYVFALLHHEQRETIDPLDLTQWTFYVLPGAVLEARCGPQKSIRLSSLQKLSPRRSSFADVKSVIEATLKEC